MQLKDADCERETAISLSLSRILRSSLDPLKDHFFLCRLQQLRGLEFEMFEPKKRSSCLRAQVGSCLVPQAPNKSPAQTGAETRQLGSWASRSPSLTTVGP